MQKPLIVYNIIYFGIIATIIITGLKAEVSGSLGYLLMLLYFLAINAVIWTIFYFRKTIKIETKLDRIGFFLVSPFFPIFLCCFGFAIEQIFN